MNDNRNRPVNTPSETQYLDNLSAASADLEALYFRCHEAHPDFELPLEDFKTAVTGAINKYLFCKNSGALGAADIRKFIADLQGVDLYLTLACAQGNEQAWWKFDRQYRSFIERLANQLVARGMDANEVIDSVYVELYGTKTVDGVRQSKFKTYTGRGTLRGWLRTVISNAAVDLYRAHQSEVSLDDWSNSGDEIPERKSWRSEAKASEESMLDDVARERYGSITCAALDGAISALDAHEKLLLLYYHVDGLKLREIARIVEVPTSSLRRWFQRRPSRAGNSRARVHESTVMRWLENVYKKVSNHFRSELRDRHGLNSAEIDICLEIATEDFGHGLDFNLEKGRGLDPVKGDPENFHIEGAS